MLDSICVVVESGNDTCVTYCFGVRDFGAQSIERGQLAAGGS
jgi:hypothetical protein